MGNLQHRGKGSFTHVENTVFFDHELSLKAKGIYCQIRSLENNPEWVFTIKGFATLVKDGVDSVSAGIKELEASGYIIRARKRSENGRFAKADEATWITLDDPAMYEGVAKELKADGFIILSEMSRPMPGNVEVALDTDIPDSGSELVTNAQVGTRTGKSRSGSSRSGKTTSGESVPINYSSDKPTDKNKPLSCPPDNAERCDAESKTPKEEEKGDFVEYKRGEFNKLFEELCDMSLKPITSLKFKRDSFAAWQRKIEEGFEPRQILSAYEAYAKTYWVRNGDDKKLAKNLIRWIEGEDGLKAFADEPIPPDILVTSGAPLSMEDLAKADPEFANLWQKLQTARSVVRSIMYSTWERPTEEEVLKACQDDRQYMRFMEKCTERYNRYLSTWECLRDLRDELKGDGSASPPSDAD